MSLLLLVSMSVFAQNAGLDSLMKERDEYYFSFIINDVAELDFLSDAISIDKVNGNEIVAYANNDEYKYLLTLGYETSLMTPPSMVGDYDMHDARSRAEYEWDKYPTYEAYESMMNEFAETYSDNCSLIELGTLESGRKILVARINDGNPDGKPKFFYSSTIHGDETTGFVMMLRLIDHLLARRDLPEVDNVINNIDLFICPNANPDGTYHGGNHTVRGATRSNAKGIDMNRNYPDALSGPHPDNKDYAMETEWLMRLAEDYQFTMAAHFHGGAEVVNYPWDHTRTRHADDTWWRMISRQYADLVHEKNPDYMTDEDNGVTNGADWYVISGSRQDYMNYYQACRELTLECSATKCPPASELPEYWDYNYNSIFALMNQALCGIHGTVKDAKTQQAVEAEIEILNYDDDYSVVKSQMPLGDFHRPIGEGIYNLEIRADGYAPMQMLASVEDGVALNLDVELEEIVKSDSTESAATYTADLLRFYPNPARDVLYVGLKEKTENVSWTLTNTLGEAIKGSEETTENFEVRLEGLETGIYFLNMTIDGKPMSKRIVVE